VFGTTAEVTDMARALWKGAITFGLVNIPVELYQAEERKAFQFAMLDKRDLSPVGYKRYSKKSGKEVEWTNIVKGYEYEKDQYVVLSDEDFRRANVKATQTIDIRAFVGADEIPSEYFETPYYLAPAGRGEKVYALLRETLRSTQRMAVAQVVIRTTQHLAAVAPNDRALMLVTLRYPDELRGTRGLDLPPQSLKSAGVSAKEIALAKRLVDDMTEHWNPAEFKDTYHADLMARIKQKIRLGPTKEITKPDAAEEGAPRSARIIDLAELLKQSLGKGAVERKSPARGQAPVTRGKAALHLVADGSAGKRAAKSAAKPTARRKRA
jgi:DNA end-binding protein Ku